MIPSILYLVGSLILFIHSLNEGVPPLMVASVAFALGSTYMISKEFNQWAKEVSPDQSLTSNSSIQTLIVRSERAPIILATKPRKNPPQTVSSADGSGEKLS